MYAILFKIIKLKLSYIINYLDFFKILEEKFIYQSLDQNKKKTFLEIKKRK